MFEKKYIYIWKKKKSWWKPRERVRSVNCKIQRKRMMTKKRRNKKKKNVSIRRIFNGSDCVALLFVWVYETLRVTTTSCCWKGLVSRFSQLPLQKLPSIWNIRLLYVNLNQSRNSISQICWFKKGCRRLLYTKRVPPQTCRANRANVALGGCSPTTPI